MLIATYTWLFTVTDSDQKHTTNIVIKKRTGKLLREKLHFEITIISSKRELNITSKKQKVLKFYLVLMQNIREILKSLNLHFPAN